MSLQPAAARHNFPRQITPFVGRKKELADLVELLADPACALLTLMGPGGTGKTRLAMQAALAAIENFADGVYFVPLQTLDSVEAIIAAIIEVVGRGFSKKDTPTQQLIAYLSGKNCLFVLDNFDHLLGMVSPETNPESQKAANFLEDLLLAAPGVKILVTSRETLNLQAEWLYPLTGLAFPALPLGLDQRDAALDYEAVQLFLERAQRMRRDFSVEAELADIVRICQLVEGTPLALELAAAWTKTLSCQTIAAEIQHNIDFLAANKRNLPQRQRSIRAVFEQSWQLLTSEEKRVFKRLSVFRRCFSADAARQIAGASLTILSALVDKSLLRLAGEGTYHLHDYLRQYAAEKLIRSPEDVAYVYDAHGAYYTDFLHRRQVDLLGGRQKAALAEIKAELENIRAAWQWAVELNRIEDIQKAAQPLILFYQAQSHYSEGVAMFELAASRLDTSDPTPKQSKILAEVLIELGWLYIRLGQLEQATTVVERSRHIYETLQMAPPPGLGLDPAIPLAFLAVIRGNYDEALRLGQQACRAPRDEYNLSMAYYAVTSAALALGDYDLARRSGQQAYALAKALENRWFMAYCLNELGNIAAAVQDYPAAKGYYEAGYAIRRDFDDPEGMAVALNHLGKVALVQKNLVEAERAYQQALTLYRTIGDKGGLAISLQGLAATATAQGSYEQARSYFQEALHIAIEMQFTPLVLSILVSVSNWLAQRGRQEQAVSFLCSIQAHSAADEETKGEIERLLVRYAGETEVYETTGLDDLTKLTTATRIELATPVITNVTPQPSYQDRPRLKLIQSNRLPKISTLHSDQAEQPDILIEALTNREFEVLQLIAQGLTNKQIAKMLVISVGTAKWYTGQIYGKLNVTNRTQAVARARGMAMLA